MRTSQTDVGRYFLQMHFLGSRVILLDSLGKDQAAQNMQSNLLSSMSCFQRIPEKKNESVVPDCFAMHGNVDFILLPSLTHFSLLGNNPVF